MTNQPKELLTTITDNPQLQPQGWEFRRWRVSVVTWIASLALVLWIAGATYGTALNSVAINWPYFAIGLVPATVILYSLDLYIRGAKAEQKDFFDSISTLVTALGNAAGSALGHDDD